MNNLKLLRKRKGLTQQELADTVRVSSKTIRRLEGGEYTCSVDKAKKLAGYFGVSIEYLLGIEKPVEYGISDLINKVNKWAISHGLDKGNPKVEWMKVTEEVGEIRDVLLKPTKFTEPQAALKDAIGDTLVTIIVLAHQLDLDVAECLGIAYEEIKNRKGKMINGTFVKEEDL